MAIKLNRGILASKLLKLRPEGLLCREQPYVKSSKKSESKSSELSSEVEEYYGGGHVVGSGQEGTGWQRAKHGTARSMGLSRRRRRPRSPGICPYAAYVILGGAGVNARKR
ncbi:hypothetical protein RUM43_012304 [Polyplax serrata]|uniref:Uncharacterized protein n=1 Tax=Polyplax serrata TaxID=468196 RepID=A0AAN8PDB5_POLSC